MGRPKGSKNRKTLQAQATETAPKRRGRPPGSKNRVNVSSMEVVKMGVVEVDKAGVVTYNGQAIGSIEYDDGVFIGKDTQRSKQVVWPDYDEVVDWFRRGARL